MTPVYYVLDLTRYYLAEPRSLACDAHVCIRVPDASRLAAWIQPHID